MVWMSVVFLLVIGGFIGWSVLNQQQNQKTNEMLAGSIASVSARQDSAGIEAQKQLAAVSNQAQTAVQAAIQATNGFCWRADRSFCRSGGDRHDFV